MNLLYSRNNKKVDIMKEQKTGFALQPANITEALGLAEMLSGSQMVPKNYKNNPQDTLVAMMMGSELGLNPIQSLQNIAVINGKPSLYGDSMLALVQAHPAFESIVESFDAGTNTATCTVTRKGSKSHTVTYSEADAKQAGLWGKAGPWTQHYKRMLSMRARGFALRNQFADALAGLISREEAEDFETEEKDVTPQAPALPAVYPSEQFDSNFPKWQTAIQDGKKTAGDLIKLIETKGALSDEQKEKINSVNAPLENSQ